MTWPGNPGGVGVLRISSGRDDRMGTKLKNKKISTASNNPQKIPGPKFQPPKNPMPNFQAKKISRKQKQSQSKFVFTVFEELHGREYMATTL